MARDTIHTFTSSDAKGENAKPNTGSDISGGKRALDVAIQNAITGAVSPSGLSIAFLISVATVTTTATKLLASPLADRNALAIRNLDPVKSIFLGPDATVTSDDTSTGGWEIGPNETLQLDITDAIDTFLITAAGTVTVKFFEVS